MTGPSLPRFTEAGSFRRVAHGAAGHDAAAGAVRRRWRAGSPAVGLRWHGGGADAVWDDGVVSLDLHRGAEVERRTSRRHGRADASADRLALTLTGDQVTAFVREDDAWVARARADLPAVPGRHRRGRAATSRRRAGSGSSGCATCGWSSHADGTPYREPGGGVLLTASSAGPGGFRTGHTSVWALDPATLRPRPPRRPLLPPRRRRARRPRHPPGARRRAAGWSRTSTWGGFDRRRHPRVGLALATSEADLTRGGHVLDARPWPVPTDGASVGTWDPHLVRDGDRWLVTYVSATAFFRFHPVVAEGVALDDLRLRAAAPRRTATEGPTLTRLDGRWWVLASDGRDGRRGQRAQYPVLDLDLREHGVLDAALPGQPPLADAPERRAGSTCSWASTATAAGGPLLGYGSHGRVRFQRGVTRRGIGS